MNKACIKWLTTVKEESPTVYPRLLELVSKDPCEVYIEYTDEAGTWVYAIISEEEPGFWLNTYRNIKDAKAFIKQMEWQLLTD